MGLRAEIRAKVSVFDWVSPNEVVLISSTTINPVQAPWCGLVVKRPPGNQEVGGLNPTTAM